MFRRTTLAPPPAPVDATAVQALLFDSFFFRTNLWTKKRRFRNWTVLFVPDN
jgi:hypothetical protein